MGKHVIIGKVHSLRGGSWADDATSLNVRYRGYDVGDYYYCVGLRLVMDAD